MGANTSGNVQDNPLVYNKKERNETLLKFHMEIVTVTLPWSVSESCAEFGVGGEVMDSAKALLQLSGCSTELSLSFIFQNLLLTKLIPTKHTSGFDIFL